MAIYDLGTASLAASGEVTGVGTTWKAPLTLIRVGATIVFKAEPVKIYTISEIISDTQINVYNPNSETVPAGTGYAILAHDGITVQGLAQDVAETLRYYQSRETEVADAVDAFNNFDSADFESKVTQVNTQHSDIVTIGAQVSSYSAQVTADKNAAAASAASASSDKDSAAASAQEAADYAASLDTENLLKKDLNFSDVEDKATARTNLDVYSKLDINSRGGYSTNLAEVISGLSSGMATISESLVIADGLSVPSFAEISGDKKFRAGFIGVDYRKNKTIRKSSNSTVTLSNQDSNAGSEVVDAVLYQDPAWPFASVFPQKTTIKNLTIEGNSAASKNQAAIYILQGGVAEIDGVDTINCKYSVWSKDIFQTRINRVFSNDGKIRLDNGTSVVISNCGFASSDTERTGAFDLTGMKYSTMISCTSDHTTNTAYSLNACEGLSMISCGCEASGTTTANSGTAIAFKDNNRNIFVSGFSCFPVPDQGPALVTFGSNNDINLTNFEVIPGINYSSDFYITGPGNNIVINGGRFGSSGSLMPVVTASGSAIGSRITYNASNGVTYDYVVAAAGVVNPVPRKSAITSILVNAEGDVIRGSGASCVREANGTYLVTLDYSNGITGASVDLYGYIGLSSFVFVDNNKVRVSLTNTDGVAVNQAFSVIVF